MRGAGLLAMTRIKRVLKFLPPFSAFPFSAFQYLVHFS